MLQPYHGVYYPLGGGSGRGAKWSGHLPARHEIRPEPPIANRHSMSYL